MKRKLALFLVLAMIISLIPANVFAASTNSVTKVPKVADDYAVWMDEAGVENAPKIRVEEKNSGEFGAQQTFRLKLTNAEWDSDVDASLDALVVASPELFGDYVEAASADLSFTYRTSSTMEVVLDVTDDDGDTVFFTIPMMVEVTGAGDVKCEIETIDGEISDSTLTFAIASGGDTVATLDDATPDSFADSMELATIEIAETKIGSLSGFEGFIVQLPAGFKWHSDVETQGDVTYSGGFATADTLDGDNMDIDPNNSKKLRVATDDLGAANIARGYIYLADLKIVAEASAKTGDVAVKIYGVDDLEDVGADDVDATEGNVTSQTLVVAKYVDYGVSATAADEDKDLPVLFAGDYEGDDADEQELSTLTIEETVASSWLTERRTRIEFPTWVKILDVAVEDDTDNFDVAIVDGDFDEYTGATDNAESYVELSGLDKDDAAETTTLELTFYVSIAADKAGDIEAIVKGTAVDGEKKVKLAVAKAPVTVTTTVTEIKTGLQDQKIGNIVITEAAEEILEDGTELQVWLDDAWFDYAADPTVKVTKGDLEIDEEGIDVDGHILTIPVKSESSEASTIEISNISVDLGRSVPEGDFWVKVGGNAIVKNNTVDGGAGDCDELDEGAFATDYVVKATALKVITPADGNTKAGDKVVFTIGSADYMIGTNKLTSDVAPYINEQGRTMLPLRTLANALGVEDRNILWNDAEHSVVIFKGDATLKVIIGQMFFNKNGVMVPMDTQAVIMNSRTFLPLRAMGEALGAIVTWDEATRTVTVQ